MSKSNKFSPEVRERAVRLVQEHRGEYSSLWAAAQSIAPKIGCSAHTLLKWVQLQEVETGTRPGVTQAEQERIPPISIPREYVDCVISYTREPGPVSEVRKGVGRGRHNHLHLACEGT